MLAVVSHAIWPDIPLYAVQKALIRRTVIPPIVPNVLRNLSMDGLPFAPWNWNGWKKGLEGITVGPWISVVVQNVLI